MRAALCLALIVIGAVSTACGGGTPPLGSPISSSVVRHAFAENDLPLKVIMDTRTLDDKQIAKWVGRARRESNSGVGRRAAEQLMVSLQQIRLRADAHPIIWLGTKDNRLIVWVYEHEQDALNQLTSARRGLSRMRREFHLHEDMPTLPITRVRNVVVLYIAMPPKERIAMRAALKRLAA